MCFFFPEVVAVGIPAGVVDVWEHTGARKDVKYTWDLTRNTNKQVKNSIGPVLDSSSCFMNNNMVIIIIINHDFLPPPRRGSHVR